MTDTVKHMWDQVEKARADGTFSSEHAAVPAQDESARAEALRLLAAEDARQTKLHDLLETIREQIRLEIQPENRPDGLFKNIQDAVYAMRGRTRLLDDAAIVAPLSGCRSPAEGDRLRAAIDSIPADLNWLIGKGKTRPDEPPYGVQLLRGLKIVAETEGDDLCAAILKAVEKVK